METALPLVNLPNERFNSAMGLHPWRRALACADNQLPAASIRPWVCTHGDAAQRDDQPIFASSFNSAMGLHPWRRRTCARSEAASEASIRPWVCTHGDQIQKGRLAKREVVASIRPWVCTHGDGMRRFVELAPIRRFNSAMGLHPWRPLALQVPSE